MSAEKLLTLLDSATEADLVEIDAKVAEAQKQLDGLCAVRKLLSIRVNGKPERKPPTKKPGGGNESEERRNKSAKYLLSAGTAKVSTLAAHCGVSPQGFHHTLNHPWFKRAGEIVVLSDEGKFAAAKLP